MMGARRVQGWSASALLAAAGAFSVSAALPGCSDDPSCSEAKALSRTTSSGSFSHALATDSVRLIAVGDTGEGNLAQAMVGRVMNDKCAAVGGCDAVIMPGDNFYDDGVHDTDDLQFFSKFEEPYALPHLEIPFYVVLGNHDVHALQRALEHARALV
jgi:hypothetical protein